MRTRVHTDKSTHDGAIARSALQPAEAERLVGARARQVVAALKSKDMAALGALIDPDYGVRFSPYAYVSRGSDEILTRAEILTEMQGRKMRVWGAYDGSGFPIRSTFKDYLAKFVYDHDFAKAPKVGFNTSLGGGNTINNVKTAYPNAITVDYHFPGFNPEFQGMDWATLRLAFAEKRGEYYLVGVIHDQWTI